MIARTTESRQMMPRASSLPSASARSAFASSLNEVSVGLRGMLNSKCDGWLHVDQRSDLFHSTVAFCRDVMDEELTSLAAMRVVESGLPGGSPSVSNIEGTAQCSTSGVSAGGARHRYATRATVHADPERSTSDFTADVTCAETGEGQSEASDRVDEHAYARQLARCLGLQVLCKMMNYVSNAHPLVAADVASEGVHVTRL